MSSILRNRAALAALLFSLCALLAIIGGQRPLFMERLERQAFDWRMARLGPVENGPNIVVVRAGEESFRRLGEWPWPRGYHAALLEKLAGAKLVAVDILFPEHSDPKEDALLADVIGRLGNVVLAMHVAPDKNRVQGVVVPPIPELTQAALDLGVTNVEEDIDGLIRMHTPVRIIDGQGYPSLALAAATRVEGVLASVEIDTGEMRLTLGPRSLPMAQDGSLTVDFSGPPLRTFEYEAVLNDLVPPETFRDAIVVVGIAASGAEDFHVVPNGLGKRVLPGTDYNALALRTLLTGRAASRISPVWSTVLIFCLGLCGLLAALPRRPLPSVGLLALVVVCFSGINLLLFTRGLLWVDFVFPLTALCVSFLAASFIRHLRLHHDWTLKSYSLSSLYALDRSGKGQESLGDYLAAIWPPLQAGTGVRLLDAQTDLEHARGDVRRAIQQDLAESGGVPRVVVLRSDDEQTPTKMALPVPALDGGQTSHYTVLGWRGRLKEDTLRTLAATVLSATWFFQSEARGRERRAMLTDTIHAIFRAVDFRDPITGGHSDRVAKLTLEIMNEIEMGEQEREDIHLGALIHDIGKIGIPDAVLGKPDKLSGDEFGQILKHPSIGEEIMTPVHLPHAAKLALAEHHERFDGSGYPKGLAGEELSLGGRIVAVADVFDALRSDRPYRKGLSLHEVCDYIHQRAGKMFDPKVVSILLRLKAPKDWTPRPKNESTSGGNDS